ncbi:putative E3 ubiquitin-protein ligase LUL3 [Cardamine amara subsp. amara]|uniref:RING-type E3 ubiquitin transferase n=1 Tax=Cardamine amara subsp. amara TaxID=228776 RepID=A0ABD0Z1G8_CARAN
MGISFSNRRRDHRHHRYHNQPPPPPPLYYYSDPTSQQPPPQPQHSNEYGQNLSLPPPPPPLSQPPPQINYGQNYNQNQYYCPHQSSPYISGYHQNVWNNTMMRPVLIRPTPVPQPPLPYVEHQNAKKVRNDVNVHKDTVRLEPDDLHPGYHLVSFVFDASFDGSFTITFFAKEEEKNWTIVPHLPEAFPPTKVPFQKGTAQKFLQPPGTGIDLGFFSLDDLSKPSPEEVYPLVITAETVISPNSDSEEPLVHQQITQAGLEKTGDGSYKGKVMKQILLFEGARYELHELYGIDNSNTQGSASSDLEDSSDKECVICLTEPKDTAIMPCRHLCLCSDCAKELRFQSNKCPICREPIKELIVIKVESSDEQL